MESIVILGTGSKFTALSGEIIADLKRRDEASIDAELLRLKRQRLAEDHEAFRAEVAKLTIQKKAEVQQSLISRGLGNTTVLDSHLRQVEQDAATELDKAAREYARGIEEIALMERRVAVNKRNEV